MGPPFIARAWNAALVTLPAAAILLLGYQRRHVTDDALIYCRAVRQILAGDGPVFNIGERAESSTSVLWQWLLALASWTTRIDVAELAVYGSLLLTVLAFVVALDGTRRFYKSSGRRQMLVPAGILLLVALPPVWEYATTGLESGLESSWLATSWWLLVRTCSAVGLRAVVTISVVI